MDIWVNNSTFSFRVVFLKVEYQCKITVHQLPFFLISLHFLTLLNLVRALCGCITHFIMVYVEHVNSIINQGFLKTTVSLFNTPDVS